METHPDMTRRATFVVGGILILLGILSLVSQLIPGLGLMVWAGAVALIGLVPFGFYLTDRSQIGLMIPAYVLWAVSGLLGGLGIGLLHDMLIPSYILFAIALPFVYGFGRNPAKNWGLLIPAYVLSSIAVMLLGIGAGVLANLAIPAYVMFAIAAPFLLVFVLDRRDNWWGLIPGGIMTAIGLGFLAGTQLFRFGLPAVLIVFGILVLFGPMLFGQHSQHGNPALIDAGSLDVPLRGPAADKAPVEYDR